MDLFESNFAQTDVSALHTPLAVRMRPQNTSEIAGQKHLLTPGSPLLRLIEPENSTTSSLGSVPNSVILWGPAGCGKTTLAYLIAQNSGRRFIELSAVSAGVKDVREAIVTAKRNLVQDGKETILFIDEVHRFSKTQQDALLPSVENRHVILVAATTENPSFSVITPLLSRSLLLTLKPLEPEDITILIDRAISSERGFGGKIAIDEDAKQRLVRLTGGDARKALTVLEAAAGAVLEEAERAAGVAVYRKATTKASSAKKSSKQGATGKTATKTPSKAQKGAKAAGEAIPTINLDTLEKALDVAAIRYDRGGDEHYDVTSAFIKSMRGSDVDAALHYLARMIVAGEDPRFIARRIMIAASEEIAMADPSALWTAVMAADAVEKIGFPEAQLILAQAVTHIATAPKSNAVTKAIGAAMSDVQAGKAGPVPMHLRDAHYAGAKRLGHGQEYIYAHDAPNAIAKQQYFPDELVGTHYYTPTPRGREESVAKTLENIRKILP